MLLLMLSCNDRKPLPALVTAEHYLPQSPDSADSVLKTIEDYNSLNDNDKALYGLLRTYTNYRINKTVGTNSLLYDSYLFFIGENKFYDITDTLLLRRCGWCSYLMGRYYTDIDSVKESEDNLRQAIYFSDKCKDYRTSYLSCSYLSDNLESSNIDEAIRLSKRALDYYSMSDENDTDNLLALLGKIGSKFIISGNLDSASIYAKRMYDNAVTNNNLKKISAAQMLFSIIEFEKNNPDSALLYAKKGICNTDSSVKYNATLTLAQCYLSCDSILSAKTTLEKMLPDNNPEHRYNIYWLLAEIASREDNAVACQVWNDSAHICSEQMYFNALSVKDSYYKDLIQKERENTNLQIDKGKKQKQLFVFLVLLLIALIGFIIYHKNKRRELDIIKMRFINNLLSLDKLKAELNDLTQAYKEQKSISSTEKEKLEDLEKIIQSKQDEIDYMENLSNEYKNKYHSLIHDNSLDKFRESSVIQSIRIMYNSPSSENHIKKSDENQIYKELKSCLPEFYHTITIDNKLSNQEKLTAILILADFSTKEIAYLLRTSESRISNIRASINHKLFGKTSARDLSDNLKKKATDVDKI